MKNSSVSAPIKGKLSGILIICLLIVTSFSQASGRDIYKIKIYSIDNKQQEIRMDKFLKDAYIPALHRAGIAKVGVFKPVEEDPMAGKLIYVLIPFKSITQFEKLASILNNDKQFLQEGSDYVDAAFDNPPYLRIQSILLRSFETMPEYGMPVHKTPPQDRIYELRSYQGATEKLYEKKVKMFNSGEVKVFTSLGFQPIFFGEVISGPIMPNLMYLTTFENSASQKEHWDAFRDHPAWAALKADPQYANTVSKTEKFYLHPTDYSDL